MAKGFLKKFALFIWNAYISLGSINLTLLFLLSKYVWFIHFSSISFETLCLILSVQFEALGIKPILIATILNISLNTWYQPPKQPCALSVAIPKRNFHVSRFSGLGWALMRQSVRQLVSQSDSQEAVLYTWMDIGIDLSVQYLMRSAKLYPRDRLPSTSIFNIYDRRNRIESLDTLK